MEWWLKGLGDGEWLSNIYRALVLQNEKNSRDVLHNSVCVYFTLLNLHLQIRVKVVNLMLCVFYPN